MTNENTPCPVCGSTHSGIEEFNYNAMDEKIIICFKCSAEIPEHTWRKYSKNHEAVRTLELISELIKKPESKLLFFEDKTSYCEMNFFIEYEYLTHIDRFESEYDGDTLLECLESAVKELREYENE